MEKSEREKINVCPVHNIFSQVFIGSELRLCERCVEESHIIKYYKVIKSTDNIAELDKKMESALAEKIGQKYKEKK